ncbi:MAG: Rpn family recombination-promoting nuclease/putative transposase [Treponema sp.]|nr:Rpn family recombination-promoting nuclease/putative transposase [Treponema sp.]
MARKPFEQLNFADDGMFQAVMKNPEASAELVERLLGVRVKSVKYPKLEKKIAPYYATKGVRLDVYLKDEDKVIDVELQTYEMDALGKRTRYYQSMVDIDSLMKGEDYSELKDSYILFICKFDPFRDEKKEPRGLYRYTFRNVCTEDSLVNLDDKCLKVIYNASAYNQAEDPKVRALLRFIQTNEPGEDPFAKQLKEFVLKARQNEKFKREYLAMNLHDRDMMKIGEKEGIAKGAQAKAIETARNMLKKNYPASDIVEITGLSLEQVLELQKELAAEPAPAN